MPLTNFAFFGSSRMSIIALDELKKAGLVPVFIVTTPDKPQGRKLTVASNVVKTWAIEHQIPVFDFARFDAETIERLEIERSKGSVDVFVVASYGKILPTAVIDMPPRKTLNIHPSLLPKYRGASPLQQAMLDDAKQTGVSIMQIDEQMDHGPILAQKEVMVNEWPTYEEFEEMMAGEGARLLADILPEWMAGSLAAKEQDHAKATFTKKFSKEDGLIDRADLLAAASEKKQYAAFRKIQAFHQWPQAFFVIGHKGRKTRVKISAAAWKNGRLCIEKVIPEGSREMSFSDFQKGYGAIAG